MKKSATLLNRSTNFIDKLLKLPNGYWIISTIILIFLIFLICWKKCYGKYENFAVDSNYERENNEIDEIIIEDFEDFEDDSEEDSDSYYSEDASDEEDSDDASDEEDSDSDSEDASDEEESENEFKKVVGKPTKRPQNVRKTY